MAFTRNPLAVAGQEERRLVGVPHEARPGGGEVAIDRLGGPADEWDEAVLAALAFADDQDTLTKLHAGEIQPLASPTRRPTPRGECDDGPPTGSRVQEERRRGSRIPDLSAWIRPSEVPHSHRWPQEAGPR